MNTETQMNTVGQALESHDPAIVDTILDVVSERVGDSDHALNIYLSLAEWSFKLNSRAHSRFGVCKLRTRTIELHAALVDHPTDFRMTLIHEIAHALEFMLYGRCDGHGPRWQRIMRDLGEPPLRTGGHTQEAENAIRAMQTRRSVETWVCGKCGFEHGIQRKRKYPASQYRHPECGGKFEVKA
jgi:predicted SprT family Zn-dependent metalloprotease